ncbi:MAG: polysaccharide pyruvyl transferase family protein [Pirellulales bacterium]|nr:polysaccharide pyruvyl transferase family protein [Pirellulales bacterium]
MDKRNTTSWRPRPLVKGILLALITRVLRLRSLISRRKLAAVVLAPSEPGSLGDEAMLVAICTQLKRQGVTGISILESSLPGHHEAIPDARMIDLSGWTLHARFVDALRAAWIFAGSPRFYLLGADVMDGRYSPGRSLVRIKLAEIAAKVGCRVKIVGFSFSSQPSQQCCDALRALPKSVEFSNREAVSQQRFQQQVGRESKLTADAAFLLEEINDSTTIEPYLKWIATHTDNGRQVLGINFNSSRQHLLKELSAEELVGAYADSLGELLRRRENLALVFLPHDSRGEPSDFDLADLVASKLAASEMARTLNVSAPIRAAEIKAICGKLNAVLTGRMHLAIAALGMGTPVGCITYLGKFDGLFAHFRLVDCLIPPNGDSIAQLADFAETLLDRAPELARQIRDHLPKVKNLALENL